MADKMQLCVFDMRRGSVEGQELDKILFFSPSDCPLPDQLSLVGLSEGLITFTRIFSPQTPCELMEAERHRHLFYQCEPDLWMVLVVEKSRDSAEGTREAALRDMLKEAHQLFVMFFGSIRAILNAHPGGDVVRSCLHAFLPDYLSDFGAGKKFRLPSIEDSLTEKGFFQLLLPQREALLEALALQSLVKSWLGGKTVKHVLIMFQNILLSSNLPQADTATLFQYATLRMIPSNLGQSQMKKGSASSVISDASNLLGPSRLRHLFNNLSTTSTSGEATTDLPTIIPDASIVEGSGTKYTVARPLAPEAWSRGADGFLETDAWGDGADLNSELPSVCLQSSEERMHLCAYQHKSLTILMFVPTSSGRETIKLLKGHLLEKAVQKIYKVEESLAREWPGVNAWHIAGYRYLYCDGNNKVSRFSPANKVATLSKESLVTLDRIRAEVDQDTGRVERENNSRDREFELCVRTKHNAWVIVRSRGGHILYVVLEKASNTLLLACEAVEKLNKRYFNGLFASD